MGLWSFFAALGAVVGRIGSGEVLHTREMTVNRGLTRLRFNVNRNPRTGEIFVVMGLLSGGNQQWSVLDADQVDELANLARSTQVLVRAERALNGQL